MKKLKEILEEVINDQMYHTNDPSFGYLTHLELNLFKDKLLESYEFNSLKELTIIEYPVLNDGNDEPVVSKTHKILENDKFEDKAYLQSIEFSFSQDITEYKTITNISVYGMFETIIQEDGEIHNKIGKLNLDYKNPMYTFAFYLVKNDFIETENSYIQESVPMPKRLQEKYEVTFKGRLLKVTLEEIEKFIEENK